MCPTEQPGRLEVAGVGRHLRHFLEVRGCSARAEEHVAVLQHLARDRPHLRRRLAFAEHDLRESAPERAVVVDLRVLDLPERQSRERLNRLVRRQRS
jgi:hypothetical protein